MSSPANPAALQLYRTILRLHRQKLPHRLRELGDSYVKKEFKDHKVAKPEFVQMFMTEWQKYAQSLAAQRSDGDTRFGLDLDEETIANMNADQRASLERLRQEATNFKR
mmetsp:Transcript_15652/g.30266  ORF Transcript_15652/g.30266 Transcript_15652/m.30266 type:complete len:109 (+) Transcript_15652:159-485(+)|eukprot:CAMPEP_0171492222 /NCGR_PEP_ID=MMETSP0958-20121227/4291_1 /TAXON_ID=87120 /ORGANISM="Aurantiochytrium limacinum, Strain ATCCMYA-1381" /LENGTH=108 /DNA_ID=CAMNT_0012025719 /DNA_START=79 /DNA_END=405 /DNA_ORIENTATION=-